MDRFRTPCRETARIGGEALSANISARIGFRPGSATLLVVRIVRETRRVASVHKNLRLCDLCRELALQSGSKDRSARRVRTVRFFSLLVECEKPLTLIGRVTGSVTIVKAGNNRVGVRGCLTGRLSIRRCKIVLLTPSH
jgi:hypothetical protein